MEIGTVLSAAQTLFAALQCKEVKDVWSLIGYKSQLEDLQRTVSTVKAVLLDADSKQHVNNGEAKHYIDELKGAVYDADDLIDKFITLNQQKHLIKGGKATKKVRRFFSRHNPLGVAYSMSQGVKSIQKKLDAIASDHTRFGFSINSLPTRLRREETCSYVYEGNIIGREDDVETIVGHLLSESCVEKDVSFLSIVGIGGLGKTALAQLVFNDARVTNAFPLKTWTCVSDHDEESFDIAQILRKILASWPSSTTNGENLQGSNKEGLQRKLREMLCNKKYLLVLDDLWTESRNNWIKLEEFFLGSQGGSWILVTTRSHETARIIGDKSIKHELQGLSRENSWCLFKKIVFGEEQSNPDFDKVKIGQEIVQGCVGVPLAIRVSGSLLYGQNISQWLLFQKKGLLSKPKDSEKDITNILKFSYHQLESPLKSCFTYCALFPKDFVMIKESVVSYWIAQGYVVPLNDAQTVEAAAEEYFSILLRRCFFQDVKLDGEFGTIVSFKMHDLLHDIAINIAGKEICLTNLPSDNIDPKVRHVAYTSGEFAQHTFKKTHIRSYCYVGTLVDNPKMELSALEALLSSSTCLRVLDFYNVDIRSLPESVGGLLHLRYLDLLNNSELEVLPKSIANLCNLQTLKIGGCPRLKELPKDFVKLVNLRTLEISECGIEYVMCLEGMPHLQTLRLKWLLELEYIIGSHESGKDFLCYPSLEKLMLLGLLMLKGWKKNSRVRKGHTSSNIMITTLSLPRLKSVDISECEEMVCNLLCPNLEHMAIGEFNEAMQINSKDMEKIGKEKGKASSTSSTFSDISKLRSVVTDNLRWLNGMPMESFSFLKKLHIDGDNEVRSLGEAAEVFRSCSSSLVSLYIYQCYDLTSVMSGGLEHLTALETLRIQFCRNLSLSDEEQAIRDGIGNGKTWTSLHGTLRHLKLCNLSKLTYLPKWMQILRALKTLEINSCKGMDAIPVWMPELTSLGELRITDCSEQLLERCKNSDGQDMPLIQHIPSIHID